MKPETSNKLRIIRNRKLIPGISYLHINYIIVLTYSQVYDWSNFYVIDCYKSNCMYNIFSTVSEVEYISYFMSIISPLQSSEYEDLFRQRKSFNNKFKEETFVFGYNKHRVYDPLRGVVIDYLRNHVFEEMMKLYWSPKNLKRKLDEESYLNQDDD